MPRKVLTPPVFLFIPGDMTHELVRHFLIETGPRGVKLKGCPNEPNFGELSLPSTSSASPQSLRQSPVPLVAGAGNSGPVLCTVAVLL